EGPLSFRAGDGNGKIGVAGGAVRIGVSGKIPSILDRRAERGRHARIGLGASQRHFVGVGLFQRSEYHEDEESDDTSADDQGTEATAGGHEPFPVSVPPAWSRSWWRRGRDYC